MIRLLKPWLCIFLFLASLKPACLANNAPVRILGIDQGLSNNAVTSIFRDHFGFMWIGTYDGLNRYDGTSFKIFKNKWGDSSSLINNHINSITEDHSNKIWIGTDKGLVVYDYANSRISPVYYRSFSGNKLLRVNARVNTLKADKDGNVYIATSDGLLFCKNGSTVCGQIVYLKKTTNYYVQTLTVDHQNRVWVFALNFGLGFYDARTHKLRFVNHELKGLTCLTADQTNENLWMGSETGLFKYNIKQGTLKQLNAEYKLSNNNVMQIYPDKHAQLWLATDGGGGNIINTITNKVSYIGAGESKGMLSSGAVYAIYEDPDSRMWIATLRGGVNIIDDKDQRFKTIANNPQNTNSLVNNFTRSFCEDAGHNIWIGTSGGGLSYWNPQLNTYQNFTHKDTDPTSLSSDFVFSILQDDKQNIWIGTFNGGIDLYNRQTHGFKHYPCYNNVSLSDNPSIWKLYEDSHHNLWAAATRGGSVFRYNREKDKFELYDPWLTNITAIFEDHTGTLWMANTDLIKIDPINKNHVHIPLNASVYALYEDRSKNFWVGTDGGGLLLFNRKTNKINRYTENDGLPSNTILNILEDESGSIWFSTFNGLCKFNSVSKKFRNYFASDGLQSNQFNFNAALKLHTGELLFGGIKGFNRFYPDSIKTNLRTPQLYLTGFKINNVSVQEDSTFKGNRNIIDMRKITLDYDKAVIAVDYVAPEYSFADKISYAYYLEGWDHAWNEVGKVKTAYYSRLNEGNYTLHIKSTNTDGVWANNQKMVYITVLPPLYRTWWAYLSYLGMLTTAAYLFWLYRTKQTTLRHEIEITNIKAEQDKQLNERKLSFFTNISHEFRTPLTLIINPIKDLLQGEQGKDHAELNTIYRNARRLLGLVDHLLLFRKTESENDQLNLVNLDFTALCNDVYLCFTHQARIKNIRYNFKADNPKTVLMVDREKMEIALFNLISNALKFTPEGGEINVVLAETDTNVMISVSDSGCGINEAQGERLFDKFYQVKDNSSLKTGFGIGLYLVKTFVKNHGGTINYKNNPKCGTTFTIELLKSNDPLMAEQIQLTEPDQHFINELIHEEVADVRINEDEVNNLELLISDKQSILIIDDNQQLRSYIKQIFKDDYKIYEADTGEKGLDKVRKYLPDVVISDITMSGLSGIELCRIIKQDTSLSHIPVILLTGDPDPETKLKGIEVGAVDFVNKPFEKDLLMARVQGILKDRRELQNYFYNEVTLKSNARNISEDHKDFLYKCIAIIENYLADPNFDVKTIADEMGMSYSSLFKKVKTISGQSVNGFVRFVRLRKAAEIMIHTNCNVNEAALNSGFNDIKYFREHFIKQFGVKPSEFIKKHRTAFHKTYSIEESLRKA
jgi:signal transduction histidine kinase/ligand-binding sensor domain-containing protein/DNA-binding response OmpR family regulator